MDKTIYFDNAATTQTLPEVVEEMKPYFSEHFGNPSGVYSDGVFARKKMNDARHQIAESIGCFDKEIIFTSCGSESDNMALVGVAFKNRDKGRHIITTTIEHHAIMETCAFLERNGYRVTYVPVDSNGLVNPSDIEKAICDDTILISVMYVNNETGVIQPVSKIADIAHKRGIIFHTDAVQAYGKIKIDVKELSVDLLSVSAHKFNGPKGIGFIYIKSGTPVDSFIHGGTQEYGLRAGTENVAYIVGMAKASELSHSKLIENNKREAEIKEHIWERISTEITDVKLNGRFEDSLPGILNFSIKDVEGESLLIMLDMKKICASTGSACAMSLKEPSHVLRAMGRTIEEARGSVRFSFSGLNTLEEADYVVDELKESVAYLRNLRL